MIGYSTGRNSPLSRFAARCGFLSGLIGAACGPALAQTAPPSPVTVGGGATITSDYRFRGISLSDRDPAVQATATIGTLSGVHGGVWASTVAGYTARGADAEVDLYAGYRRPLGSATIDAGLLYVAFPGGAGAAGDRVEPYVTVTQSLGPISGKIGVDATWKQSTLAVAGRSRGDVYGYGELSAGIPTTPVTLTAHLGRSFVSNYMTFGQRYTDWSLAGAYVWHALTFSLTYVDTDADIHTAPTRGGIDRRIGGAGVLASLGFAF